MPHLILLMPHRVKSMWHFLWMEIFIGGLHYQRIIKRIKKGEECIFNNKMIADIYK